jgi:hypothetical protein
MPSFQNLINKGRQNVTKFFNSTLPTGISSGIRFFNSTIVPTAKRIHNVHSVVAKEIRTNPEVPKRLKEAEKKSSAFADLGLQKLGTVNDSLTRVGGQLGLV